MDRHCSGTNVPVVAITRLAQGAPGGREEQTLSDKSPRQSLSQGPGKSIKQKRAVKKANQGKASEGSASPASTRSPRTNENGGRR